MVEADDAITIDTSGLSIDQVVDAVEANQEYAKQFGVNLLVRPGAKEARVLGDKDRLMQVLANLVSNAVKHSPKGGDVGVETLRNAGYWRVTVTDNGPGIPESFHDEIFKKFAQADASDRRKRGGTGLGLAICKQVAENHNGKIWAESEYGQGTNFSFVLPITERRKR